jgi:hypothetical protein
MASPAHSQHATAEAFALSKTQWSAPEYRALADRLLDASQNFQAAITTQRFPAVVSAYHDLHEISFQLDFMNAGLMRAIEAYKNQESNRV